MASAVVACTGGGGDGGSARDGGPGPGTDSGSTSSSGGGSTSSSGSNGGAALERTKTIADELIEKGGYFTFSERTTDGGVELHGGGELFDTTGSGATCTETARGVCHVLQCNGLLPRSVGPMVSAGSPLRAGTANLTSPSGAARSFELDEQNGFYAPTGTSTKGSAATGSGDLVTTGDVMPAFTAKVTMPARIDVSAPAITAGAADFVLRYGAELPVAFSGAGNTDVEILVGQAATTGVSHVRIRCVVPGASGGMTISSELMTMLERLSTFQLAVSPIVDQEIAPAAGYRVLVRGTAAGAFLRGTFTK